MFRPHKPPVKARAKPAPESPRVVVIGAGMGGLACAIRLAARGYAVTVVDAAQAVGGKARAVPSVAGPVDTGPTVLTLRDVFDALFALNGERLDDHVTLHRQPVLARHWWDGSPALDLFPDRAANIDAIRDFAGAREADAFARFDRVAGALYTAFDAPVMRAAKPDLMGVARAALQRPAIWPALLPHRGLTRYLRSHFRDPRLVQLFGRYATYVGARPDQAPPVLSLIWRAEAAGVWAVAGGMHSLARELGELAHRMGVRFRLATRARRIIRQGGRVTGVEVEGATIPCEACVYAGDPAALAAGLLGDGVTSALPPRQTAKRSLSAHVWAFAASPQGPRAGELLYHNVFFSAGPEAEFGPIGRGEMPEQPTLYICAEDRQTPTIPNEPERGPERFEIILNAPANLPPQTYEVATCHNRTFPRLKAMGLTFSPAPQGLALMTPAMLARDYPASQGAIYGQSAEGPMAAFKRPQARTAVAGLYLAGGGVHPGAGVPMAALSGQHAAEAIAMDLTFA